MKKNLTTFERRIEMLFLLISCRKTTITELMSYFDVSRDSIFRDLSFLSRYAPIYTKPGMFGGVFLMEGYKKNILLPLSDDEKLLLEKLSNNLTEMDLYLMKNIINKYSKPEGT